MILRTRGPKPALKTLSRLSLCGLLLVVIPLPGTAWAAPKSTHPMAEKASLCRYHQGVSDVLIVGSTLLLPDRVIDNGGLAILPTGKIGQVGKFTDLAAALPEASVLDCRGDTLLSPGWVNIHEHEAYSYAFPDPDLRPVYSHREEWIFGRNDMPTLPIPAGQNFDPTDKTSMALLTWVELRHLIAGTTTIGGPGAIPGLATNIGLRADPSDAAAYPLEADLEIFPFSMNAIQAFSGICDNREGPAPTLEIASENDLAYAPHLGEGRKNDCTARSEIDAFISHVTGNQGTGRRFSAIHAVAAGPGHMAAFSRLDVSLVWSPRSNLALYGETINLEASRRHNVRLALGTDWSPSGSFNMLEELACARAVIQEQGSAIDSHQLWQMATQNAAYAVGLENTIGQLKEGLHADLVLIQTNGDKAPYAAAVNARVDDVQLVWVNGAALIASSDIADRMNLRENCVALPTGGKVACIDFGTLGIPWKELQLLAGNAVPISGDTRRQAACKLPSNDN
jgi:cytosine/adenosine deaminase-related metal-dependent hydrolase